MAASKITLEKVLPWMLVIVGIVGIVASIVITNDKFDLAANPAFRPNCDLNPVVSCGSVMASPQAHAFGVMNPYVGLIGFPVLVTIGMALFAGARFKRWFWLGMQAGLTFGIIFAYWLLYESVYAIHALCPYCLSVDLVLTIMFWYGLLYIVGKGYLPLPKKGIWQKLAAAARAHHLDILILWFLIVIFFIFKHFWYYFGSHLF
ncbi:MAG TPA: vitamin K epoxide reductase family protein [Candidatus Saccharimonadales bacterium]